METIDRSVRWAVPADYDQLGELMYDAVRNGPSLYTEAQRAAWMPQPRCGEEWNARLNRQMIILGERHDTILGFMSVEPNVVEANGYVDFAYIRPHAQGTGLFRTLLHNIEEKMGQIGVTHLSTDASLMAHAAFKATGFASLSEDEVGFNGQMFKRYKMDKSIGV